MGESYRKLPAKNVLCSNGNTKYTKNAGLLLLVVMRCLAAVSCISGKLYKVIRLT